jgi:acylphosphatase
MPKKRLHLIIDGLVQGVSFRWHALREASSLGLTGFVKNNPDGSVEAVFEGEEEKLKKILEFCRKGPSGARVEKIEVEWDKYEGKFRDFGIVH